MDDFLFILKSTNPSLNRNLCDYVGNASLMEYLYLRQLVTLSLVSSQGISSFLGAVEIMLNLKTQADVNTLVHS